MDEKILSSEKGYLARVEKVLDEELAKADAQKASLGEDLVANRKDIWDNLSDMDDYEQSSRQTQAELNSDRYVMLAKLLDRLGRQKDAPYFGKLDFGSSPQSRINLYLGLGQITDKEGNTYVVDWRAPVADLYYDHNLGEASYRAPKGEIKCTVFNKYQFGIKGGELQYAVDTSTTILDEVLLKELSKNASPVMRNIVSTIQAEQNKLIRASFGSDLLVQGVAGSGKTSIALHRIAYILYHSRSIIKPKEIWIVTPNKAFTAYIGNVLPELGEEMVPQCSMEELAYLELKKVCARVSREEHLERLYSQEPSPERVKSMQYKSSVQFAKDIARFARRADQASFRPRDVVAGGYVCPKGTLEVLYYQRFAHYPAHERIELIAGYVERELADFFHAKVPSTLHFKIQEMVGSMYTRYDIFSLYRRMLRELAEKGAPVLLPDKQIALEKGFAGQPLPYEDVYGLALLKTLVEGSKLARKNKVKHLVVDEMQDYTPVQYAYLNQLFRCPKTVLGDMGQMADPYLNAGTLDTIKSYLGEDCRVEKLPTSYRSSYEITMFANRYAEERILPIDRHGEEPLVKTVVGDEVAEIQAQIDYAYAHGLESVAVICRNQQEARKVAAALQGKALLLLDGNTPYRGGTVVTTAFHVKGFEFDQVILPQADDEHYAGKWGKQLLYISCTRALHRLVLLR